MAGRVLGPRITRCVQDGCTRWMARQKGPDYLAKKINLCAQRRKFIVLIF